MKPEICEKNCPACKKILQVEKAYSINKTYEILVLEELNCESRNIYYVTVCTTCGFSHFDYTRKNLREKYSDILDKDLNKINNRNAVANHFRRHILKGESWEIGFIPIQSTIECNKTAFEISAFMNSMIKENHSKMFAFSVKWKVISIKNNVSKNYVTSGTTYLEFLSHKSVSTRSIDLFRTFRKNDKDNDKSGTKNLSFDKIVEKIRGGINRRQELQKLLLNFNEDQLNSDKDSSDNETIKKINDNSKVEMLIISDDENTEINEDSTEYQIPKKKRKNTKIIEEGEKEKDEGEEEEESQIDSEIEIIELDKNSPHNQNTETNAKYEKKFKEILKLQAEKTDLIEEKRGLNINLDILEEKYINECEESWKIQVDLQRENSQLRQTIEDLENKLKKYEAGEPSNVVQRMPSE